MRRTLALVPLLAASVAAAPTTRPAYPEAKTVDVVDNYHGTPVPDPYRWLETPDSPETRAFIDAQNVVTDAWLPGDVRDQIRARMEQLVDYPRTGVPGRVGRPDARSPAELTRLFVSRNTGLQDHSVLFTRGPGQDDWAVTLDPNTWSDDGTTALAGTWISDDGTTMAYGVSEGGSDDRVVRIMDLRPGKFGEHYPETLEHMRFSGIAWHPDGSGFWYSKYPDPGSVPPEEERFNQKIFWHELETDPADDVLVYANPDDPELSHWPTVTNDGRFELIYAYRGTDRRSGILYRELCCEPDRNDPFIELFPPQEAEYSVIDDPTQGTGDDAVSKFVVLTNSNAPAGRVVLVDPGNPAEAEWVTIIPEPQAPGTQIESVVRAGDRYVVEYMQDAKSVLKHYALDGSDEKTIELPTVGTVTGITADRWHDRIYFGFTGYTYPTTPFKYDLPTGSLDRFADNSPDGFDPETYETRQVFYESKDGTRVPMFITHKKGLELDGTNPTILYGYGGFNVSLTPGFSSLRLAWLEQGGVYAVANIRGGGEYGQAWHEAAKFGNRQNAFDDFIAAGEFLIDQGYTNPDKLAIQGGSNGGLLVAAVVTQRPELFGAVHSSVPVIDMLRYHTYGTGRFWTVEWGNAEEDPEAFEYLMAYSPLHNVGTNVDYPPILVTTGDGDDRVVPAHSLKWVAALQANNPDSEAVLLRYDVGSGHGAGKPISKILDEQADIYAFFARALGMDWN
jgi:prolyl oligopeptidase